MSTLDGAKMPSLKDKHLDQEAARIAEEKAKELEKVEEKKLEKKLKANKS